MDGVKCVGLIALAMACAACTEQGGVGFTQSAVHAGTTSTVTAAGSVACSTGEYTGGAFLTRRHFLRLGVPCVAGGMYVWPGPLMTATGSEIAVLSNHEMSTSVSQAFTVAVLAAEADVTPAVLSTTAPAVDDAVTVVGYGAATYDLDPNVRSRTALPRRRCSRA